MKTTTPILYLDNTYTFGGAINSLEYLLRALNKEHFSPVLVTGQPAGFIEKHFRDCIWYHYVPKLPWVDNFKYRRVAAWKLFRLPGFRQLLNLGRFCYWLMFITLPEGIRYYQIGKRHDIAVIHLNNILGSQLAGIIAAKLLRIPCVAHLRDFEEIHPITRLYARLIDYHIAISGAIRNNLRQLGVSDERITVVFDAIDLDEFRPDIDCRYLQEEFGLVAGQPVFGIFGRVVDWKGIHEFLCAARQVADELPDAKVFVVGGASDGDEEFFQEMRALVLDLDLEDQVVFTGYREDVSALMKLMDVVVHASTRPEPFGMVVIEAMAMSQPVVATRGGGPLDIVIDGETGFLVPMKDVDSLALAVGTMLRQPELRRSMGEKGRRRVEALFANQHYANQMEAVYRQALEG